MECAGAGGVRRPEVSAPVPTATVLRTAIRNRGTIGPRRADQPVQERQREQQAVSMGHGAVRIRLHHKMACREMQGGTATRPLVTSSHAASDGDSNGGPDGGHHRNNGSACSTTTHADRGPAPIAAQPNDAATAIRRMQEDEPMQPTGSTHWTMQHQWDPRAATTSRSWRGTIRD